MSVRSFVHDTLRASLTTVLLLSLLQAASAQVMQSGSYQINSDSINFGGGFSSSTNYQQESTFGEVATGVGTSASYSLYAGYQQMQSIYLALTGASTVTMTPALGGVTGGNSFGSTTVTVTTDDPAGYQLTIAASESPALRSNANTIANYAPLSDPDFSFAVSAGEAFFGYSPEGGDIVTRFQDSGGVCNQTGGDTALRCWDGLSTSAVQIAGATNANHPTGATTTIQFQVGVGSNAMVPPGTYVATTTVTAIAL